MPKRPAQPLPAPLKPLAIALLALFATPSFASVASEDLAAFMVSPDSQDLHRRSAGEIERIARAYGLARLLPAAPNATHPVTNCSDSGAGSLRAAAGAALSGDTIDLRAATCSVISLTTGQIVLPQTDLTILGPGRESFSIIASSSSYENRVFNHTGTGTLLLQGFDVSGGTVVTTMAAPNGAGGCIRSAGTLMIGNPLFAGAPELGMTIANCSVEVPASSSGYGRGGGVAAEVLSLTNSTISGCTLIAPYSTAGDGGGGAFARRRLLVSRSEIIENEVTGTKYGGGGLAAAEQGSSGQGPHLIQDSTIAANHAPRGGGVSIAGTTNLRNVTISGNLATNTFNVAGDTGGGGGIAFTGGAASSPAPVTVYNTTITANHANHSGGGILMSRSIDIRSTIVAGNTAGVPGVPNDIEGGNGSELSGSANLFGTSLLTPPSGTLVTASPGLKPLASNGGRTQTHALEPTSLAIDRGANPADLATDQRGPGYARVIGLRADIGAFELDVDRIFVDGFD